MAFAEIELARIEKKVGGFCRARTRPEIRDQLRLEYQVDRQDVELFEVRPHWREPGEELHTPVAKFKYVRSVNEWRLYWMRQDLKWHGYEPFPASRDLEDLLEVVSKDGFGCFFG